MDLADDLTLCKNVRFDDDDDDDRLCVGLTRWLVG